MRIVITESESKDQKESCLAPATREVKPRWVTSNSHGRNVVASTGGPVILTCLSHTRPLHLTCTLYALSYMRTKTLLRPLTFSSFESYFENFHQSDHKRCFISEQLQNRKKSRFEMSYRQLNSNYRHNIDFLWIVSKKTVKKLRQSFFFGRNHFTRV